MIKSNIKEELKMWKAMPNSHKNDSYYKKHFPQRVTFKTKVMESTLYRTVLLFC